MKPHKTRIMKNTKKRVGRPTKYKPEYCQKLIDYFNQPLTVKKTVVNKQGDLVEIDAPNNYPMFCKFAFDMNIDVATIRHWGHAVDEHGNPKHPEFHAAYKQAKCLQEYMLVNSGLQGIYDKTFAIFTAKNVIGYRDKTEQTIDHRLNIGVGEINDSDTPQDAAQKYRDILKNG